MQAERTFKGVNLEDLLEEVRTEVGASAKIVHVDKVRSGGVFGFFPKEFYEVTVANGADTAAAAAAGMPATATESAGPTAPARRSPAAPTQAAPQTAAAAPRAPMPSSAADLADIVNTAERLHTAPPTTTMPTEADDPSGSAFGRELKKAIGDVDHARLAATFGVRTPEADDAAGLNAADLHDDRDDLDDDVDDTFTPFAATDVTGRPVGLGLTPPAPAAPPTPAAPAAPQVAAAATRPAAQPPAPLRSAADLRARSAYVPAADDVDVDIEIEAPHAPLAAQAPAPAPAPAGGLVRQRAVRGRSGDDVAPIGAGLLALGLPAEFLPAGLERLAHPGAVEAALAGALTSLPTAEIEIGPGDVAVVVGARDAALELARGLAVDLGCDPDGVVLATPDASAGDVLAWMRITSPAIARRRLPTWRRRETPTVIALEAPLGLRNGDWVRGVLGELCPTFVLGIAHATTKPADVARWVHTLEGVDALALADTDATGTPAAALGLQVPVAVIDGMPASAAHWAELLVQRLADDQREARF